MLRAGNIALCEGGDFARGLGCIEQGGVGGLQEYGGAGGGRGVAKGGLEGGEYIGKEGLVGQNTLRGPVDRDSIIGKVRGCEGWWLGGGGREGDSDLGDEDVMG